MSNNINPTESPQVAAAKALTASMIRGNSNYVGTVDPDPEEKLVLKDIRLQKDELMLFKNADESSYYCADLAEKTQMNNTLLSIMQRLFADVFSAQLEYSSKHNKWLFVLSFRFLTADQFKAVNDESEHELLQAVSSTFDPSTNTTGSIGENLIALNNNQNMTASDATKYARITKEAKELLTNFVFFPQTNSKKRWVRYENYDIHYFSQPSYNGQVYSNIVANVYLDAEKVLGMLCCVAEDRDKYKFTLAPTANKVTNMDSLFDIKRINKARRRKLSAKYGIQFSN